jgi:hypothetical protein
MVVTSTPERDVCTTTMCVAHSFQCTPDENVVCVLHNVKDDAVRVLNTYTPIIKQLMHGTSYRIEVPTCHFYC